MALAVLAVWVFFLPILVFLQALAFMAAKKTVCHGHV
jgi:hypothetical protein